MSTNMDPKDQELSRAYREASGAEPHDLPPPALDDAIRAAARRAVQSRPRKLWRPFTSKWQMPIALAASIVFSMTLTIVIRQEYRELLDAPPGPIRIHGPIQTKIEEPHERMAPAYEPAIVPPAVSSKGRGALSMPEIVIAKPELRAETVQRDIAKSDQPQALKLAESPPAEIMAPEIRADLAGKGGAERKDKQAAAPSPEAVVATAGTPGSANVAEPKAEARPRQFMEHAPPPPGTFARRAQEAAAKKESSADLAAPMPEKIVVTGSNVPRSEAENAAPPAAATLAPAPAPSAPVVASGVLGPRVVEKMLQDKTAEASATRQKESEKKAVEKEATSAYTAAPAAVAQPAAPAASAPAPVIARSTVVAPPVYAPPASSAMHYAGISNAVRIEGGSFRMGTATEAIAALKDKYGVRFPGAFANETPEHTVTLSTYRIDRDPVTVDRYARFVAQHPEWSRARVQANNDQYLRDWENGAPPAGKQNHPVTYVTWAAAQSYCLAAGGRLPTEAEWEYAARARGANEFPWGDEAPDSSRANYRASGIGGTTPVDRYQPNALGLHDMAGNVWQWMFDAWRPEYSAIVQADPARTETDPARGGSSPGAVSGRRAIRGGSFDGAAVNLRTRWRDSHEVNAAAAFVGFRCAYPSN